MPKKGKENFDYFDSFEALSGVAVSASDVLIGTIENFTTAEALLDNVESARELEHKGDHVNRAIYRHVGADFITPIEREDIIELAQTLDDIVDHIESVIRRCYMYDIHSMHADAVLFGQYIKRSCVALDTAMKDFRNFKKSKKFKALIQDVSKCEEEFDGLFVEIMRRLYTDDRDRTMRVWVWTQIFERMEQCCDTCEHASDVMNAILLKNA